VEGIVPGLILLGSGLLIWIVTRVILRAVSGWSNLDALTATLKEHEHAVLVVRSGGRAVFANQKAREMFQLHQDEALNLERLARKVRPGEQFLALCSADGQARFMLGGRLTESNSYSMIVDDQRLQVLVLQKIETASAMLAPQGGQSQALQTITEINQAIVSSLNLEVTLQAIMESVEKVMPADFIQIALWDRETEQLLPYRFEGFPGMDNKVALSEDRFRLSEGFSGTVAREQSALLIPDVSARPDFSPAMDIQSFPLQSYIGAPLMVGKKLIGTLDLGALVADRFQQEDLEVVELLSGQVAIAIHNSRLYHEEKRRGSELASLSQMTQALCALSDPATMFARIVESIKPLFQVDVLGFLIYDPESRILAGRQPFHGLPDQFIELYQTIIEPNSEAERILEEQDVIFSDNAAEDARWEQLGLSHLAKAASLRDTVLMPLLSGGRMVGYLQASNHKNETAGGLSHDELRLLTIIANQAALIVENSHLRTHGWKRNERVETLRRISALTSSATLFDDILAGSLKTLAKLVQADVAFIFLINQESGRFEAHQPSFFVKNRDLEPVNLGMPMNDPQYLMTLTARRKSLLASRNIEKVITLPFYQSVLSDIQMEAVMVAPLVVRDKGVGELWVGSRLAGAFNEGDLQVLTMAANQLAGVVDQECVVVQTDESLRQRVDELTTLARISSALGASLDIDDLINQIYEEALRITNADCGSIMLFETNLAQGLQVRFSAGDRPLDQLSAIELCVLEDGVPLSVSDVDAVELPLSHPGMRSALIAPIIYREQRAGLMILHAEAPDRFDADAVDAARTLAAQAAMALGNALQYEEETQRGELLKRELEALRKLFQISQSRSENQPLQESLSIIAEAIQEVTPFQTVIISIYNAGTDSLRRVCAAGVLPNIWEITKDRVRPWEQVREVLKPEYRVGVAYFLPVDRQPLSGDGLALTENETEGAGHWDPQDVFLVPLYTAEGSPAGVISVDAPVDGRQPDRPTLEALELFAMLAGLMIEYDGQSNVLQNQINQLGTERESLQLEAGLVRQNLPLMLSKELDQTLAIRTLQNQMTLTRAGLDLTEMISRQPDISTALEAITVELLTRFEFQAALVADNTAGEPRLLHAIGSLLPKIDPSTHFGQPNPLRQILQTGEFMLSVDLQSDSEWKTTSLLASMGARCFIGLPLQVGDGLMAGVLLLGKDPLQSYSSEDHHTYVRLANQISIGLQNLRLLTETRRHLHEVNILYEFSRNLGSFEQKDILSALVTSVMDIVPAAEAGWVALTTPSGDALQMVEAVGYTDRDSMIAIRYDLTGENEPALPARIFTSEKAMRFSEIHFASQYQLPSEDLLRYKKGTGDRLPVSSLAVPISLGEQPQGVLVVDNFGQPYSFTEEDEALALALCRQASLALQNAKLFAETNRLKEGLEQRVEKRTIELRQEHRNSQALLQIITTLSVGLDASRVIDDVLEIVNQATGAEQSVILPVEAGADIFWAGTPLVEPSELTGDGSVERPEWSLMQEVVRKLQMHYVEDTHTDERWSAESPLYFRSLWMMPLILDDAAMGVLMLFSTKEGFFQTDQYNLIEAIARQLAIALNNATLYHLSMSQTESLGVMLRNQQTILESIADGVLVTDAGGHVATFNASAERILQLPTDTVMNQPVTKFSDLFGKTGSKWLKTILAWSQNPDMIRQGGAYSEQIELDEGLILSVRLAPVIWNEEFLGTVSIFRDITQAVMVDRLKAEFVTNVSHELRTPMTAIKGYIDILVMGAAGEINQEQLHFLEIVNKNIERLDLLVSDLLDISRIESDRVVLSSEPVDLRKTAEDVVAEAQIRAQQDNKPISINLKVNGELPVVYGDPLRVHQIINNLVSNAYHYTPEGGSVIIRIHPAGNDEIQVDVEDNGIGIAPENQHRIFERFYRGEDPLVLATAGTGLGLAITRALVEKHNGRIWFQSEGKSGKGSVFSLVLPAYHEE
jgi:GAF domain-containing protein/nitrogen-specific signal transduction histidine kinase